MEGLVVLVLISWLITSMNAKKRNQKGKTLLGAKQQTERSVQARAEQKKRRTSVKEEKKNQIQEVFNEGESSAAYLPMEELFRGSMETESTEGECICDPELEHEREAMPPPESVYAGEIGKEPLVDFSAHGILQGIVMSEILKRPSRHTGRYGNRG